MTVWHVSTFDTYKILNIRLTDKIIQIKLNKSIKPYDF